MKKYNFNEEGLLVEAEDQSGVPQLEMHKEAMQGPSEYRMSDQFLTCVMATLNNGIAQQRDITQDLLDLQIVPAPNGKLYVRNPPVIKFTPELEAVVKEKFFERMEDKMNATV